MSTAIIPLKDFIVDPEKNIDLCAMPQEEAVALIKKSFDFLSSSIDVSIRDGVAVITLPEAQTQRMDDALKSIDRAEKHAKEGDYRRAIQLFLRALEVIPAHTDARRNLAMAYLETGDQEKAKDLLVQVLALDPKDEWAYVLLGNIYSKHEKKFEVAEKFYRRAYELDPRDAILLTNYGALMVEKGNREQATEFFERAIEANPTYPSPYYALALLYLQDDKPNLALPYLEDLFAKGKPGDVRTASLYDEARKLYLETNKRVAEKSYDHLMKWVEEHKQALEKQTGYRIQIREDNSLEGVFAVTQMAWTYGRDYHWVRYRDMGRAVNPHHLAHEMEHILLEHQAREQGRNRIFTSTKQNRERGIRVIGDWIYKMRDKGFPEKDLTDVVIKLVGGLTNQIFNCPLDMIIEYRAHQNYPVIHNSQFVALGAASADGLVAFANKDIKRLTPPLFTKLLTRSIARTPSLLIPFTTAKPNTRAPITPKCS